MPSALNLDAATVRRLAATPAVRAEFAFLKPYAVPVAAGCCGGAAQYPDYARAVVSLLAMPADRKARFKELVGADRVVAVVKRAARVVKLEF